MFGTKTTFPKTQLIPLIIKLGDFLKIGYDKRIENGTLTREDLATLIEAAMVQWGPKINGLDVMDQKTKKHCASFLAGVAINMTKEKTC